MNFSQKPWSRVFLFSIVVRCWFKVSDFVTHEYDSSSWRHLYPFQMECCQNEFQALLHSQWLFSEKLFAIVKGVLIGIVTEISHSLQTIRCQEIYHTIEIGLQSQRKTLSLIFQFFWLKTFKIKISSATENPHLKILLIRLETDQPLQTHQRNQIQEIEKCVGGCIYCRLIHHFEACNLLNQKI